MPRSVGSSPSQSQSTGRAYTIAEMGDSPYSPGSSHNRSSSEGTEIEVESSTGSTHLNPSRIPVSSRTRRKSDSGPPAHHQRPPSSNSFLPPNPDRTPTRPKTPATLSNRRYSPKRLEANQSLTAVVTELPPKLSPTLRSSRPRQPVSAASTAASRAKAADRAKLTERFTKTIVATEKSSQSQRSTPKDFVRVDIASRRDQVNNKLSQSYVDRPKTEDDGRTVRAQKSAQSLYSPNSPESPTFPGSFPDSPPVMPQNDTQAGAIRSRLSTLVEQSTSGVEAEEDEDDYCSDNDCSEVTETSPVLPCPPVEQSPHRAKTLLKQVLALRATMRGNSPARSETMEDYLSEHDDAETINVALGDTPNLPQDMFMAPEPSPIPELDEDESHWMTDARSSICPDDSVSMIFQRRMQPTREEEIPPVPPIPHFPNHQDALREEGRREIRQRLQSEITSLTAEIQERRPKFPIEDDERLIQAYVNHARIKAQLDHLKEEFRQEYGDDYTQFTQVKKDELWKRREEQRMREQGLPRLNTANLQRHTVDSTARSQINRVLEQYQSGKVTPEMADECKEQLEQLTPNMAQHANWNSPTETTTFLRAALDDVDDDQKRPSSTHSNRSRRASRAISIEDDLRDDDGYRGTAIIYSSDR
jgi:hypothetical protein